MRATNRSWKGLLCCRAGLTLIELLVAAALSSLLILMAVVTLGGATDAWKDSNSAADALGDGRAAMLILRRDFANRLRDTPVYVNPRVDSPDGLNSNVLAFYTALRPGAREPGVDRGNIGMVAYYRAFTPDLRGGESPKLFRVQISPQEVWRDAEAAGWDPVFSPDPIADEASGRSELVAANVLQFAVTGLVQGEDGEIIPVPATITSDKIEAAGIDLLLRLVESGPAARLLSADDWAGNSDVSATLFDRDGDTNDDKGVRTFRARF